MSAPGVPRARYDVVVVGLGPVGVVLTLLLGRLGLNVLAIEREDAIFPLPRAAHVDHEIMRIFQSLGIVDAISPYVRAAPDYEFRNAAGAVLMRFERQGRLGVSGWPLGFNIYQPGVEAILRRGLDDLDSIDARYGVRFAGVIANTPAGATLELVRNGAASQVEARFVVACDGAASPVRDACGIGLDDYLFDEPWLVVDTVAADESGFPAANVQYCDPARPTSFIHMGPGRLRWEFMLKPDEDPARVKTNSGIAELLKPWRTASDLIVERAAVYRFHGLVAQAWRRDSIFLAGDAAHQMPPFMGQGLCSGLRDAANLAWKLGAVIDDPGASDLLATYQVEREPHVRVVIERAIAMGRIVCTLDPSVAKDRDDEMLTRRQVTQPVALPPLDDGVLMPGTPGAGEIFPQPVDRSQMPGYLDDVLGPGAWLISGTRHEMRAGVQAVATADLPPAFAVPLDVWLADREVEAVLVRPDRYVFGSGTAASLVEAYSRWFDQGARVR